MKERREYVRAETVTNIRWAKETDQAKVQAQSCDIGGGGVCLVTKQKLNPGDLIYLDIDLPKGGTVKANGKVVWTKAFSIGDKAPGPAYYTGVEFVDISEEDRALVEKYVFEYYQFVKGKA